MYILLFWRFHCISLVLITWLCTLKYPFSMILFYFMSLWYISIMNYKIRWATNVKIIQSRSRINYLSILINSIYKFWTILNLGSISEIYSYILLIFLTLYANIAYVNFKIVCRHIDHCINECVCRLMFLCSVKLLYDDDWCTLILTILFIVSV